MLTLRLINQVLSTKLSTEVLLMIKQLEKIKKLQAAIGL
jgi:hypothetical protein